MPFRAATRCCHGMPLLLAAAIACAGPRVHSRFATSYRSASTLALVAPDVRIDELSILDMRKPKLGWTAAARENVARGIAEALERRGFTVVRPAPTPQNAALQDDLLGRYRQLEPELIKAWRWPDYGFAPGPFEFSIGPVEAPLAVWGADMLVLASGGDQISDALRAVGQIFRKDATWGRATLQVALVDRSGTVVWFCGGERREDTDLRSASDAANFAGMVLDDLPRR